MRVKLVNSLSLSLSLVVSLFFQLFLRCPHSLYVSGSYVAFNITCFGGLGQLFLVNIVTVLHTYRDCSS